ncbi:MAG: hypothetical protein CME61_00900 [Halobacteriovoraceae bacterium]|nr:hypothetical protein [Halobacteriovoraceae bacterium]
MRLFCYDIGSFSLKKTIFYVDKKVIEEIDYSESDINLKDIDEDGNINFSPLVSYLKKEKSFWDKNSRVALILPDEFSTSRFFNLPVNNKKKARQVLPFKLEDTLPFPAEKIISKSQLYPGEENSTDAIVNIVDKGDFESLFNSLEKEKIYFDCVTTGIGLLSGLSNGNKAVKKYFQINDFAILDIGHQSSRCYLFKDYRLVSNHHSVSSGSLVTENISDSYNISLPEAERYKKEESFFLTEEELENVDEDQKVFALFMEKTMEGLTNDFHRWSLGFRTKTNSSLQGVYLVGQSSKIQNIEAFLSEKLELPVQTFSEAQGRSVRFKTTSSLSQVFAIQTIEKLIPLNFLGQEYRQRQTSSVPIRSALYLFNRVALISIIVNFFVVIQLVLNLYSSGKFEKKYQKKLLKNKLNISKKKQITFRKVPLALESFLDKKIQNFEGTSSILSKKTERSSLKVFSLFYKFQSITPFVINKLNIDDEIKAILEFNNSEQITEFVQAFQSKVSLIEEKSLSENIIEVRFTQE